MHRVPFLFFLFLIIGATIGCSNENNEKIEIENKITPVEVGDIEIGDLIIESSIYGNVSPKKQVPVFTQQPGEITDLKVENGDNVKKDDRLGTIKTQMGRVGIFAPIDGEVGQLQVEKNDFFNGEEPFAIIFDDEQLLLHFSVTDQMQSQFKVEKKLNVNVANKGYKAEIIKVEKLPNESGQYNVTAQLENEKGNILPGASAEVILKEVREKNAILIPTEAIITESEETFIYLIDGDKAKKIKIEVLQLQSDKTAIKADVNENEKIITSGQFLLADGSQVEIVKEGK